MKRLRHSLAAATRTMVARWAIRRLQAGRRREWMDRAWMTLGDRDHVVVPRALLESPALVALASRVLPATPVSRDRRRLLRVLLLSAILAATATSLALAIAAFLRARRRSRAQAATTPAPQPVVIPVATARVGDGEAGAAPGVDVSVEAGDHRGA